MPLPQFRNISTFLLDVANALAVMVRHLLFGSLTTVRLTIQDLHKKHYAEPNDWSKPISTGRSNEVMANVTKHVAIK
ncbi:MAG: hypothetical protein ACFB2W_09240 [Leptolyngbyaceae cyanobacterium]